MKRLFELTGLVAGIALALVAGTAWDRWIRWTVMVALGVVIAAVVLSVVWRRIRDANVARMRGITSIGRDHYRQPDYAHVWEEAQKHVLCVGLAMTHVSANLDPPKEALARGVRIDFVMLDPEWIQRSRTLARAMNQYYGNRRDLVSSTRSSFNVLSEFAREMNLQYGEHAVRISLFREISLMSVTLSDAAHGTAKGIVEFHLFQGNHDRIRLHLQDLPRGRIKPVITDVRESLRRLMPQELSREIFGDA